MKEQNKNDAQKGCSIAPNKKKMAIIAVVVAILVLNIFWTLIQKNIGSKIDSLGAGLTAVEQKVASIQEGGLPDLETLRNEFKTLEVVAANYNERLENLVKAEESRLEMLQAQVEAQKKWVESLKQLSFDKK